MTLHRETLLFCKTMIFEAAKSLAPDLYRQREALEVIAAKLRALAAEQPETVCVPVEPTEAMYAAAEREWDGRMSARSAGVWKAMLAAAIASGKGEV